jgi:methyl-accepting chemotaxis protein
MALEHVGSTAQTVRTRRPSRFLGQYIIKSHFQFKFSLIIFIFLASVACLVFLEGHWVVENMISTGAVTNEEAIAQLRLLNSIIGRTSVLGIAIVFGLSLFFSHFVAGPIYRFQKTLEEMREGKLNLVVSLRKHDELKDVADSFNQALASLRNRVKKEREALHVAVEKARPLIERLRKEGRAAEADELTKVLTEIKNNPPQIQI